MYRYGGAVRRRQAGWLCDFSSVLYFAPEKNNVIFCSAIDGWAFTVKQFAVLYEKKLGIKRALLEKVLWGDYYLDPKTKRVLGQKHLKGRNLKPMFVQLVLESIWAVYNATTGGDKGKGDPALLEKITKSLGIVIPPYVLRSRDPRNILTKVFSLWLPLSTAVLISVIEYLPSPPVAQAARLPGMIKESPGSNAVAPEIANAMVKFDASPDAPAVAYVSKVVSIPESELPSATKKTAIGNMSAEEAREAARRKREEIARIQAEANGGDQPDAFARTVGAFDKMSLEDNPEEQVKEDPEHLIGYARLYSGVLSVGDEIYVLPPKWSPDDPHTPEPKKVTVKALYLLMGRALENLDSVPAGMVFGIAGLEGHILKTGTLCSRLEGGINLAGVTMSSPPIVRVALEPVNPADLGKMIAGLKMLERSDPCAQYMVLPSGEHVIITAGELHLERCLKDLRERYAKCEIQAGEAIVPYRETIVKAADMAPLKNPELPRGTVMTSSASNQVSVQIRVRPLPAAITDFLTKNAATIKKLFSRKKAKEQSENEEAVQQESAGQEMVESGEPGASVLSFDDFKKELKKVTDDIKEDRDMWAQIADKIIEFGPRRFGANVLIDATELGSGERVLGQDAAQEDHVLAVQQSRGIQLFSDKLSYAFQLATLQGPLCHEPVQGIAVFIEKMTVAESVEEEMGRLTGEIIRHVREAIHQGFLEWSPRILLAMYSCEIQASAEVLGRVYGVITRRRGRILSEMMKEGTPFFTILSLLPVAESFGFSDEIRKRTSGAASPQLIFSGFEMLDEDPFWVPATEEELEDLGELADKENLAKKYVDRVRERKGLFVQGKKLVRDAEKQKTLKR
ncbi:Cytoplasmic GTPase/eEF2-like protein (ribosomal biogenesis) [Ascosphaera pollenicola]|nr:Cytoplasmic GTPase/eEF2-like protein (ribosomal biogenesis) [Ascosphaera pollenicola]